MDRLTMQYRAKADLEKELELIVSRISELKASDTYKNKSLESNDTSPADLQKSYQSSNRTFTTIISKTDERIEVISRIAKCESEISYVNGEKHGLRLGFWVGFGLALCISIGVTQAF